MGAAASIESLKPLDASDISQHENLQIARDEVARLRNTLGQYAKSAGFAEVVYDVSDLVLGVNEYEDFDRCIAEIKHIRSALRLSTQNNKRKNRNYPSHTFDSKFEYEDEDAKRSTSQDSDES
jgi:hypothetical protein